MNYTDPATLPPDVKAKLLRIREALLVNDCQEAYHQLYSIACPDFGHLDPWAALEKGARDACAHSWQWAKTSAPCEPAELVQVCSLCGAEKEEE